jgi:hypothetical protein
MVLESNGLIVTGIRTDISVKEGSISFLEKKKQKTFVFADVSDTWVCAEQGRSFLVLFFKKELLPWSFHFLAMSGSK